LENKIQVIPRTFVYYGVSVVWLKFLLNNQNRKLNEKINMPIIPNRNQVLFMLFVILAVFEIAVVQYYYT
jgi:hypothetical protein